MKHLLLVLIALTALAGPTLEARSENARTLYTCGMHPQVIQDHPGNCPICGMKLTPVRKQSTTASAAASNAPSGDASNSAVITIEPGTTQTMDLRTGVVTRGPL